MSEMIRQTTRRGGFGIALASLALAGCSTTAIDPERVAEARAQTVPELPPEWTSARERVGAVEPGWIAQFNDPILDVLVAEALANNRDLRAARANVLRAQGLARQAGAALVPNVDAVGSAGRQQAIEGGGLSSYALGGQLGWEADIWGRIASGERAAVASARSAEANYIFAQYAIAGAVAQSYFLIIEADQQVAVAQSIVDSLTEIRRIVSLRYRYGFASAFDVSLAESDLASARDSLAAAQNGRLEALRALEALLGRYPAATLATAMEFPTLPPAPGAGVPAELLERRPDVISAERGIAAALNSLDAAEAARLPSLQITGALGGASGRLEDLFDPTNILANLGASILFPIFDGGRRQAQVDIADADLQAAIAAYGDTAITAFTEVESALDRGVYLAQRREALERANTETGNALRLITLQYQEGEIDLIDVLSIQQRVFGAQSSLLSIRRAQLDQYVELSLALGGSWTDAESTE